MKRRLFFYTILFITIVVVTFYLYIGIAFGNGVAKMGKSVHNVQKEWKENKEEPLDTIKDLVVKKLDSVN
ncbi:hypothetical protein K6T82_18665 [Flavobacterium sp. 17A]|uniref:Uncharacterized protein n=1 Tax=Flavobacterium potami TaxID=2872310 RepID=A0A9X1HE38_9FLAO|nr:hypothetical protein [Flavobacterium potami]MBZ4036799.1 hypothetical protein [Flavobacterium potami]